MSEARELRACFRRTLEEVGACHPGNAVFEDLLIRYGEPHRHYHTLNHVTSCLRGLDRFAPNSRCSAEVGLALWFHDAIYDPRRGDNEVRSTELARQQLGKLGVESPALDRIARFIEATQHHHATCGDAALVVDLDLVILGTAPAVFNRFEEQVRKEYAYIDDTTFRFGRRRVLESFCKRTEIYRTHAIALEFETIARRNLEERIAELAG